MRLDGKEIDVDFFNEIVETLAWFAIGLSGVFSLTGWSRQIHAEFLVLRATQDTTRLRLASHTQLSCSMAVLSRTFCSPTFLPRRGPTTPPMP